MTPQQFVAKSGAPEGMPGPAFALNEEQGAQSHFLDLCDLLDVPKPGSVTGYRFEEKSNVIGDKTGYCDVFMQGVFAWENKAPGKNLDTALKQLLTHSLALANPPLVDAGHAQASTRTAAIQIAQVAKRLNESARSLKKTSKRCKKRTLTNLYNLRPAWLTMAHQQLDAAVAATCSWADYTADAPDDEILKRLLALNLERYASGSR